MPNTHGLTLNVGILIAPTVCLMDVVGGQAVFGFAPGVRLINVGKTTETVMAWGDLPVAATSTYADCPRLDALIVGAMGPDTYADPEAIQFVKDQAARGAYMIGVCAGVLLFGAAGLLDGRRATTNLHITHRLHEFGCEVVEGGSVVEDGKLLTAGPATGSYEASLMALARLAGDHLAKTMELTIEYHPKPVFGVGTADLAGPDLTAEVKAQNREFFGLCVDVAKATYTGIHVSQAAAE